MGYIDYVNWAFCLIWDICAPKMPLICITHGVEFIIMRMTKDSSKWCILLIFALISTISFGYSGGIGTSDDPWQISSKADLLELSGDTAGYNSYFVLTADIDFGDKPSRIFTSALIAPDSDDINYGFQGTAFSGVFDGGGHTIKNLTMRRAPRVNKCYLGLFGKINGGVVKNLTLDKVNISGGIFSEYVGGLAGECSGDILNCRVSGTVYGNAGVGAITGCYQAGLKGVMSNCSSSGTVGGYVLVGGVVGINCGSITDCSSTCQIIGDANSNVLGGLVGKNDGGSIRKCFATGNVSGFGNLGGLAGWNQKGKVTGCYAKGTVTGDDVIGGLVGLNCDFVGYCYALGAVTGNSHVGGLVGNNNFNSNISKCYAAGLVTGTTFKGGLAGLTSKDALISDSFWDRDTTKMFYGYTISSLLPESIINVRSMTTKMLQTASILVCDGWNFGPSSEDENCWRMRSDIDDYPKLAWQFSKTDLNGDSVVDVGDLQTMSEHWLTDKNTEDYSPLCDLDPNGSSKDKVDLADFMVLIKEIK